MLGEIDAVGVGALWVLWVWVWVLGEIDAVGVEVLWMLGAVGLGVEALWVLGLERQSALVCWSAEWFGILRMVVSGECYTSLARLHVREISIRFPTLKFSCDTCLSVTYPAVRYPKVNFWCST